MPNRVVRRLNGPRGSALLAVALIAAPFAVAYSPLTNPPANLPAGLMILSTVIPIVVYGALWTVSAVLAATAAWTDPQGRQRDRLDRAAWALFVGLLSVWAASYFIGWVLYLGGWEHAMNSSRSYIQAGIYFGVALFVAICARAMPCREADLEYKRQTTYRGKPHRSPAYLSRLAFRKDRP